MDHFSQETRKNAWYATDSRRAVSGQLIDIIREKRGEAERPDLSGVEAVRMGLVLQPAIGNIFQEVTGIGVRSLDTVGTHRTQDWLKCHFDFETDDGGILEVKNFNAAVINKYPDEGDTLRLPEADYIQCLHEATVRGVSHCHFAVLFGGQRFRHWRLDFTAQEQDDFIARAAQWWAMCHNGAMPAPETTDQARYVYPADKGEILMANRAIEEEARRLKAIKASIKELEEAEERTQLNLMAFMGEASELVSVTGETLCTWKLSKGSKRFNAKKLEADNPSVYKAYCFDTPGTRRFLVK